MLALATLPLLEYGQFLSNDAFLYSYDSGQSHLARFEVLGRSLREEHQLPLWQATAYAGGPFHANPENATLYPPVLLLAAFLPPLLAMNLTVLAHLSLGVLGMALLVRRLSRRVPGAGGVAGPLLAGALFGLNAWCRLEHFNLVTYGAAHALLPWVFLAADGLLTGARPTRWTGALALLLAAQFCTGGLYVFAYTVLGVAAWFGFLGLAGGGLARRRTLTWGLLALALALLMILAKWLPYLEWVSTTNRAGALDAASARGVTLGGKGGFDASVALQRLASSTAGGLTLLGALCSLALLRSGTARVVLGLGLFGALASTGVLHGPLLSWLPPFDRIRNALRAWTLANAFLSAAAGLGVGFLVQRLARRTGRAWLDPLLGAVAVALALPLLLDTGRHQQFLERPFSRQEVLGYYPQWHKMVALAGDDWRVMCLNVRSAGTRNEQFIASALEAETPAGFFGYAYPLALARHAYFNAGALSREVRARRLEVLSVRYGTYNLDHQLRTAKLRGTTFPGGVDGPRIQGFDRARPRAFVPPRVGAIFGDPDRLALYAVFDAPAFRTEAATLLSLGPGESLTDEEAAVLDEIVVVQGARAGDAAFEAFLAAAQRRGAGVTSVGLPLDVAGRSDLAQVARRLSLPVPEDPPEASFHRIQSREVRVICPRTGRGRFVVVSETFALYGGWEARGGGRTLPIRSADGVASAVFLRAQVDAFSAGYDPASFASGWRLGLAGLLGACLLLILRRKA